MERCREVGPKCPVEATLYGYAPNLAWNAFFAGFFGLSVLVNAGLGIRYKTWTYMVSNINVSTTGTLLT